MQGETRRRDAGVGLACAPPHRLPRQPALTCGLWPPAHLASPACSSEASVGEHLPGGGARPSGSVGSAAVAPGVWRAGLPAPQRGLRPALPQARRPTTTSRGARPRRSWRPLAAVPTSRRCPRSCRGRPAPSLFPPVLEPTLKGAGPSLLLPSTSPLGVPQPVTGSPAGEAERVRFHCQGRQRGWAWWWGQLRGPEPGGLVRRHLEMPRTEGGGHGALVPDSAAVPAPPELL